jgi:hypothetical protein
VGDLADGEYTLTVTLDGWKEPLVRTFTRKHFPFEGNKLGITDEVLPPFTPIKVKGKTVSVVYRDYEVGGLGLWSSIKAAGNVSAGGPVELLAGPMSLKVKREASDVKNETEEVLTGKGTFTRPRKGIRCSGCRLPILWTVMLTLPVGMPRSGSSGALVVISITHFPCKGMMC